ncbi:hypothetical protein V8E36_006818 [Tilletia maclaganii]
MKLPSTLLFITIVSALGVQALDSGQDSKCLDQAAMKCPTYTDPQNANAYHIWHMKCIREFWKTLTTSDQCPHPKVRCDCYNGCVKDRWRDERDVGGWCTEACRTADKMPASCI